MQLLLETYAAYIYNLRALWAAIGVLLLLLCCTCCARCIRRRRCCTRYCPARCAESDADAASADRAAGAVTPRGQRRSLFSRRKGPRYFHLRVSPAEERRMDRVESECV